ncbi:MAG: hypothetical protein AB8G77_15785 [Rhodothermales bacterium]
MIKLGKLILNGGMWHGNQLVSSDWIKTSTTHHVEIDNNPYGFLWWINRVKYGNKEIETITARGNGGQVIFIVPEFALVSAFTAGYYNSEKAQIPYRIFYNIILPAVDEMKPFLKDIN